MVYLPTAGHLSSTNLAVHGWEWNLQPVDYKFDTLSITPPNRLFVNVFGEGDNDKTKHHI